MMLSLPLVLLLGAGSLPAPESSDLHGAEVSTHVFGIYARTSAMVYLSAGQTTGGVGGGIGLRDTVHDRFLVQADLTQLSLIGTAFALRLGAGIQRRGTWVPAALVTGTVFLGDRLRFLTPDHPEGVGAPAHALGVALAPLRFRAGDVEVTLLELGVGAGWDWPGVGATYNVTFLEVGTRF